MNPPSEVSVPSCLTLDHTIVAIGKDWIAQFEGNPPTAEKALKTWHLFENYFREIQDISQPAPPTSAPSSLPNTVITDMGEFLTRVARALSSFTDLMVTGPHVEMAVTDAHEQSRRVNNVSDVEVPKSRKIRDLTEKLSREVQDIWQTAPSALPPDSVTHFYDMKRTVLPHPPAAATGKVDVKVHSSQKMLTISQMSPTSPPSPGNIAPMSDNSGQDEDEQFARIDMEALKQRGKGSYYCPRGHRCDKGGVDKDGHLVLFGRNSSFAQHCNKHRKPWWCDVPGCPNPPTKRKFARRDGLDRHKATVKHRVISQ
ncbi:hypothetical protein EDB81DRAFT_825388 [Dactylonectria macrodidyma]|uniref:Uncharacterized protein n=1 Tax=Dactylonectria macrodidyma TaxID=307937 RepID=A0A9P9IAZ9_9HYPO|nr:hypothetical protein EDB81DRAFT_825388 [Dactylonectria macrodidyma]